ncbi:MAG: glycosyltransferase family 2 protein [Flavobacterium sp.]
MLSILIPTYNYNAFSLVSEIHKQITREKIPFEIICLDDASTKSFPENEKINHLKNTQYEILEKNIGRSKIRNLLAKKAKFDWLLFLDVDVLPKNEDFIAKYIPFLDNKAKIVSGGMLYQEEKPKKDKLFRWIYGKNRESLPANERQKKPYVSFLTLNFLIHKSIFERVYFNETLPNLRHEDTLFSYNLMQYKIVVEHIDNPIYHLGLDDFDLAIKKENESLIALKHLLDNNLLDPDYIKISKALSIIKNLKLTWIIAFFYKASKSLLIKNLSGNNPSLFLFDLYRLGYYCMLNSVKK